MSDEKLRELERRLREANEANDQLELIYSRLRAGEIRASEIRTMFESDRESAMELLGAVEATGQISEEDRHLIELCLDAVSERDFFSGLENTGTRSVLAVSVALALQLEHLTRGLVNATRDSVCLELALKLLNEGGISPQDLSRLEDWYRTSALAFDSADTPERLLRMPLRVGGRALLGELGTGKHRLMDECFFLLLACRRGQEEEPHLLDSLRAQLLDWTLSGVYAPIS